MANAVTLYEKVVRETTKPPTGITITRDGNKFKVSWKIGDKNYGGGQRLWWQTNNGYGAEYKLGSKVTSKTITVDFSKYNPPTGKKLEYIEVFILGLRSNYTTTTNKRKVTHKMDWSLDAEKTYTLDIPNKPKLTAELDDEIDNRCKFSWETVTSNTAKRVFTDVQWQSKLLKNSTITDGEKAFAATGVANTYESGTGTANSSKTITEDNTYINGDNSYTRWFRVRARGPAGVTGWVYRKHVYAKPNAAGNISASAVKQNNGYLVTVEWTSAKNASRPIDSMIVQYAAVVPAAGITVPPAASWTDAATVAYKDGTDKAKFLFADELDDDQVLFVRVTTKHDHEANDIASDTAIALVGALALPTLSNVVTVPETHRATITATNNSAVSDSFLVIAYKQSSNPGNVMFLGVITGSSTSATVQCPDWGDDDISFGVYAAVGNYDAQTGDDGVALYDIYPYDDRPLMTSEGVWDNGQVPKAPDNVAVTRTNTQGTVRVTWENTWDAADGVELTWSDHADAWESTDQPSSFIVSNVYTAGWYISNLDVGKTWYIRVRLVSGSGDDGTPGPWSEIIPIELAESPNVPVLELSQPAIPEFGTVTASWGYVSKDGTPQAYAEICEATITAQGVTYGDVIARVTTPQHVDINAEEVGWAINNTYLLCVRVGSASGQDSEWSDPVPIEIVPPLNIAITQTSLQNVTIEIDSETHETESVLSLIDMPFTCTVTGAGATGTTTVAIERAGGYFLDRPDERTFTGHEGETIALVSQTGEAQISIDNEDLIGTLDDGAPYRIVATISDGFGQSAEASIAFEVHWDHQAVFPTATVEADNDNYVSYITPIQPQGYAEGDTVDIYRLSVDRPELIYSGAEFGTTYVDPFPALGEMGGHRIVYRTANGDYITEDNEIAWTDYRAEDGDGIDTMYNIINFGTGQVQLMYDITLNSGWDKDFQETKYLGGHIQGDWNNATSRSGSIGGSLVVTQDQETIQALRRLGDYPGICHVRTRDGSSYAADVQVSESRDMGKDVIRSEFTLTITRVDPEGFDGMTYDDWESEDESE